MSLIRSAPLNGYHPTLKLTDILERLPTRPASRFEELLTHRWLPRQLAGLFDYRTFAVAAKYKYGQSLH
jgi:hypothetical protein